MAGREYAGDWRSADFDFTNCGLDSAADGAAEAELSRSRLRAALVVVELPVAGAPGQRVRPIVGGGGADAGARAGSGAAAPAGDGEQTKGGDDDDERDLATARLQGLWGEAVEAARPRALEYSTDMIATVSDSLLGACEESFYSRAMTKRPTWSCGWAAHELEHVTLSGAAHLFVAWTIHVARLSLVAYFALISVAILGTADGPFNLLLNSLAMCFIFEIEWRLALRDVFRGVAADVARGEHPALVVYRAYETLGELALGALVLTVTWAMQRRTTRGDIVTNDDDWITDTPGLTRIYKGCGLAIFSLLVFDCHFAWFFASKDRRKRPWLRVLAFLVDLAAVAVVVIVAVEWAVGWLMSWNAAKSHPSTPPQRALQRDAHALQQSSTEMLQQRDAHALQQRDARALQRNDAQALDAALQQQQRAPLQPRNASDTTPQASPRAEGLRDADPVRAAGGAGGRVEPRPMNHGARDGLLPDARRDARAASPRPSPRRFFGSPRPAPPVYRQSPGRAALASPAAEPPAPPSPAAVAAGVAELRRLAAPVEADTCSICLEALDATDKTLHTIRKCGHRFHLDCIRGRRKRMAFEQRAGEPPTPATPPLRFTLTDDDPVF
ncbi:methyltransferase [Aureococcus anophagefferens]|nr:methyltransferase [Aureococcus anophagefferens]